MVDLLIFSDITQFVILVTRKGGMYWCGRGVSVGSSSDPMGLFNVFDDFFLRESCIFFEILFAIFVLPMSSQIVFCFWRLVFFWCSLFLRSSTSISNWWIVIAWLLTVSFSSANQDLPSISSLFSCAYVLASWAVVSTAFTLR